MASAHGLLISQQQAGWAVAGTAVFAGAEIAGKTGDIQRHWLDKSMNRLQDNGLAASPALGEATARQRQDDGKTPYAPGMVLALNVIAVLASAARYTSPFFRTHHE